MSAAGTVLEHHPARLLAEATHREESGILRASRGKHRRLICMHRGNVVFVASNVIEEQLEALLERRGRIDRQTRDRLTVEAKGAKPGSRLLREDSISPEELYGAACDRVRELLLSTFEWPDGEYRFEHGQPDLEGELTVELSCLPLILEHAKHHPRSLAELRKRVGPSAMRPIRTAHANRCAERLALEETGRQILQHARGSLSVKELLARIEGSTEEVLRALYGLMLAGAVRPAKESEIPKLEAAESISRQEVLGRLERLGEADHYAILGLAHKCTADEVREAYYYLARRYHPDRFRTGHLQDLLDRMEAYFTKVTEAYNTLVDPAARERYDEEALSRAGGKAAETQQDTAYLARQNFARGKLLLDKKQFQDAVRFFENALQLDSSKAQYHLELGRVLILNPRRRGEAEELLRTSIAMNPALVQAYLSLGELYTKTSRRDDAVAAYEEALRWDTNNEEAQQRLTELGGPKRRRGRG